MSHERIRKLLLLSPSLFFWKTSSLEVLIGRVGGKLGIAVDTNRFVFGMCGLGSMRDERLELRCKVWSVRELRMG